MLFPYGVDERRDDGTRISASRDENQRCLLMRGKTLTFETRRRPLKRGVSKAQIAIPVSNF